VRHVLQPVRAAALDPPQNYNVVLARLDRKIDVLFVSHLRVADFKTFQIRSDSFGERMLGVIGGVNKSVPAVEHFDVRDAVHTGAIVLVVF